MFSWLFALALFIFSAVAFSNTDLPPDSGLLPHYKKILILDAGSSGARIMEYRLVKKTTEPTPIFDLSNQSIMVEEERLKPDVSLSPNISSFISTHAFNAYQQNQFIHFFLGATAGLRSMNSATARRILLQKAGEITSLGVPAAFNENARLLKGLEEGSYTWFGVNFILRSDLSETSLSERLEVMSKGHTSQYGIIEMGGGSVQVGFSIPYTFQHRELRREDPNRPAPEFPNVKRFNLPDGLKLDVYSKSHPQSGLNFAFNRFIENYLEYPASNPCLNQGYPVRDEVTNDLSFAYGNYHRCRDALNNTMFPHPQATFNGSGIVDKKYQDKLPKKFFLTGYFYDRTTAKGLPEKFTLGLLEKAARHVCNMDYQTLYCRDLGHKIFSSFLGEPSYCKVPPAFSTANVWKGGVPRTGELEKYCTHLTYISLFLEKIGIASDQELYTQKYLPYRGGSFGVSWPLGYAILSANDWL